MKKRFKILLWIFSILILFFVASNIFMGMFAPRIVEKQIEENLKLKSSLGKISLSPPFIVTLDRLEIGNLATIKKVSFSPNLISLMFGKIVIHGLNVVEPLIHLEMTPDGKLNLPVLDKKGKPPAVYLTSLKVQEGKIIFTDKKADPNGYQLIMDKLNLKISKVAMPVTSLAADFNFSGRLLNSGLNPIGNLSFSGWVDYPNRSMDAKLEVKDLNVVNFSPYYGNFISNKKLSSGTLNLSSIFKAENNQLKINTDFNLSGLVYENGQAQEPQLELAKDALDLFTDSQGNLRLEFQIETKLDNPSLSPDKVKGIILKAAMKNLSSQSPEQLIDKVQNTIEKYKDLGKQLKEIFGK